MFSPQSVRRCSCSARAGLVPVFAVGRWWTVLSAGWLHGGVLHILFNMMAVRQLAPATAELYGPGPDGDHLHGRAASPGFALSSFAGAFLPAVLLPARRPVHGRRLGVDRRACIGAHPRLRPPQRQQHGAQLRDRATSLMLVIMGFLMPGIDNYAHAGGFGGGYLAARLLDPLKPERIDHIVIALVCLAASLLSIVVSVIHGLQFLSTMHRVAASSGCGMVLFSPVARVTLERVATFRMNGYWRPNRLCTRHLVMQRHILSVLCRSRQYEVQHAGAPRPERRIRERRGARPCSDVAECAVG